MANELVNAYKELRKTLANNITGLRYAPDYPPENASAFPFMVIAPESGSFEIGQNDATANHVMRIQIHVARKDLGRDIETVLPYGDLIKDTIGRNLQLGGTIDGLVGEVSYTFGAIGYAGVETVGFDFSVTMHVQSAWNGTTYVKG